MESQPQTTYLAVYKVYHPQFAHLNLYGGQYPGSADDFTHSVKVHELLGLGITTTICLMEADELLEFNPYVEEMKKQRTQFTFLHYPIKDMDVPTSELMQTILNKIDELIAHQQSIYVHCWGGHGRTGAVIGCWLKRHGFNHYEALKRMRMWRRNTLFGDIITPQTASQHEMIIHWQAGQ